jgi:hypothetical protein
LTDNKPIKNKNLGLVEKIKYPTSTETVLKPCDPPLENNERNDIVLNNIQKPIKKDIEENRENKENKEINCTKCTLQTELENNNPVEILNNEKVNYKNFNLLDIKTIYHENNNNEGYPKTATMFGYTFDTYNDFYLSDNYVFYSNLNLSDLNKPIYNTVKNNTIIIDNEITITEARLKYFYNKQYSISIGIIPLFRGLTYKYDSFNFNRNDGSSYISGLILQGIEGIYKNCKHKFYITIGHGYYEKYKINDIELHNDKVKGSDGSYIFLKKKDEFNLFGEKYSFEYDFELSKVNYKYDRVLGYQQYLLGNNFAIENESQLFWLFHGYQKGEGSNYNLYRNAVNLPIYIPNSMITTNTNNVFIGDYKTSGSNLAIGYKYSFDLFQKENFTLFEYYKTFGNWVSPIYGEPFSEYGLGRLGNQKKFVYGYFYNPKLLIKGTYLDTTYDKTYKLGGSMVQTDISNFPNLKTKEQNFILSIQYLF